MFRISYLQFIKVSYNFVILLIYLDELPHELVFFLFSLTQIQWFEETGVGSKVRGGRVLIVDEVDDTRTTLKFCVDELIKTNSPKEVAVAVVQQQDEGKEGGVGW